MCWQYGSTCGIWGFLLLQKERGQPISLCQELQLSYAGVCRGREGWESSSTFPILGKEKYIGSITASTASKGGETSNSFISPQPRVLMVLHFLCCQNY